MHNLWKGAVARWLPLLLFGGSKRYWRDRYRLGGNSGSGSTSLAASYKAGVLNQFVADQNIHSVVEFGCGDGRQLALGNYPRYVGFDISIDAIGLCKRMFANDGYKQFGILADYHGEHAELALSLDVIYHLVEDTVYYEYLDRLFAAGRRFVVVYSTNAGPVRRTLPHVRHRRVSADVEARFPEFSRRSDLEASIPSPVEVNGGIPTVFLIYERGSIG